MRATDKVPIYLMDGFQVVSASSLGAVDADWRVAYRQSRPRQPARRDPGSGRAEAPVTSVPAWLNVPTPPSVASMG